MFDTNFYNNLPSVADANAAFVDRERVFAKLAPLFAREEYKGRYSVCLVHHHFKLSPGERMTSAGLIAVPERSSPDDPLVIPERWTVSGEPFEFRRVASESEIVPPPPASLLKEFRDIVGKDSVLGIALVADPLPEGLVWWETTRDVDRRAHIVEPKELFEVRKEDQFFDTAWMPKFDGAGYIMLCCGSCTSSSGCYIKPPSPPPRPPSPSPPPHPAPGTGP